MTTPERHRDEALAMVEKLAHGWHDSAGSLTTTFTNCPAVQCVEAAQFLVRVHSEMLKEEK